MAIGERSSDAEQAFRRRMAKRTCGHCGSQASEMKEWGGQRIAICQACQDRLSGPLETSVEEGYDWRALADSGPWCDRDQLRPCDDCFLHQVEGRILDSPAVEIVRIVAVGSEPRRSVVARAIAAVAGLLRR